MHKDKGEMAWRHGPRARPEQAPEERADHDAPNFFIIVLASQLTANSGSGVKLPSS